jgi:hypothetical protein
LDPSSKLCPPEAWSTEKPIILIHETISDVEVRHHVAQSRDANGRDSGVKEQLCVGLSISIAALANEGIAIYSPRREVALDALNAAQRSLLVKQVDHPIQWTITTNRTSTRSVLEEIGAQAIPPDCVKNDTMKFLSFQAS